MKTRTNVEIDDALINRAKKAAGLKTKREVIEYALNLLVSLSDQAEIRNFRGKLKWRGNLDSMREDK